MTTPGQRRGVNLHLSHSWGGGVGKWVADFAAADPFSENLALECLGTENCFGAGQRLSNAQTGEELANWSLAEPINEVQPTNRCYRTQLRRVIKEYEVDHLYVSSLTGHTLDAFDAGVPVTRVHHDFFPYCPALHCFRGTVCTACGEEELTECLDNRFLKPMSSPSYYLKFREILQTAYARPHVRHVTPNPCVWRQLCRLDSRLGEIEPKVIEHGVDWERRNLFAGAPATRRLRLGMLGHLRWPKGLHILRAQFEQLRLVADFVLLGSGAVTAEFARRWGITAVSEYRRQDLPELLERFGIDIALFLSVTPETFSYTLSEVWAHGIPPLATPVGSLGERIRHGENGFLVSLDGDCLMDELLALDRNRGQIRAVASRILRLQIRTTEEMVRDYYSLRSSPFKGLGKISPKPEPDLGTNSPFRVPQTDEDGIGEELVAAPVAESRR